MMQALWLWGMLFANLCAAGDDTQTPILPPIQAGQSCECSEAPDHAEIMRALPRVTRIPFVYEHSRDDVTITVEKLADQVDPTRFFPLVGPAQLHHVHWMCIVHFTETKASAFPFPFREQRNCYECVYIDKDHLHLCAAEKDDAEAQEADSSKPAVRVRACWETGLTGSVYVFSNATNRTIEAAGRFEVEVFDMAPALTGEAPRLLARWLFDGERLEKLKRKDMIGDGYTLNVYWSDLPSNVANIKLQTTYVPAQGASCSDEPTYLTRRNVDWSRLFAEGAEEKPKVMQAQAVSNKGRDRQMTLDDVITLSKRGIGVFVIFRQMELTGSTFSLTVADIVLLHDQGVSDSLIQAMQDSGTARPTVVPYVRPAPQNFGP